MQPIGVRATGQIAPIETHCMIPCGLHRIDKHRHLVAEQIVHREMHLT